MEIILILLISILLLGISLLLLTSGRAHRVGNYMYDLIGREYGAMLRNLRKYKDDNAYIIHFLKTKEDMKRQYDKMFYMFWIPLKDKYWLSKQEIEQLNENKK